MKKTYSELLMDISSVLCDIKHNIAIKVCVLYTMHIEVPLFATNTYSKE